MGNRRNGRTARRLSCRTRRGRTPATAGARGASKARHEEQDGENSWKSSAGFGYLLCEREAQRWEGKGRDYFDWVTQNPLLAELSHARINAMIHAAGVAKLYEV